MPSNGFSIKSGQPKKWSSNKAEAQKTVINLPAGEFDKLQLTDLILCREEKDSIKLVERFATQLWNWIESKGCASVVNPDTVEDYALLKARWLQCEVLIDERGIAGASSTVEPSYVKSGRQYHNEMLKVWHDIEDCIKAHCVEQAMPSMLPPTSEAGALLSS